MTPRKRSSLPCECSDPACPVHPGKRSCKENGTTILYRVDIGDETGTLFCDGCAVDAMESGVFTDSNNQEDE